MLFPFSLPDASVEKVRADLPSRSSSLAVSSLFAGY
jgi:hypothetical protein